jgi:hypothetical protein
MRRSLQIIFILLYVASTYATKQALTRIIVSELQHSSQDDQAQTRSRSQIEAGFPKHREAKPNPTCSLDVVQIDRVDVLPVFSECVFHLHIHSLKSLNTIQSISSRAPPLQS